MNAHDTASKEEGENATLIILISSVTTIGGFLFGFDSGVINGTVTGLQTAFEADSTVTGFSVASMLLGCALGACRTTIRPPRLTTIRPPHPEA